VRSRDGNGRGKEENNEGGDVASCFAFEPVSLRMGLFFTLLFLDYYICGLYRQPVAIPSFSLCISYTVLNRLTLFNFRPLQVPVPNSELISILLTSNTIPHFHTHRYHSLRCGLRRRVHSDLCTADISGLGQSGLAIA